LQKQCANTLQKANKNTGQQKNPNPRKPRYYNSIKPVTPAASAAGSSQIALLVFDTILFFLLAYTSLVLAGFFTESASTSLQLPEADSFIVGTWILEEEGNVIEMTFSEPGKGTGIAIVKNFNIHDPTGYVDYSILTPKIMAFQWAIYNSEYPKETLGSARETYEYEFKGNTLILTSTTSDKVITLTRK
ncbi:MAG: hypothetical protein V1494_04545, partial [Candidatus Diapherotrites archaeon]